MDNVNNDLAASFDEMHSVAREIVLLREVVELNLLPKVRAKITVLQALAATAQRAAMSVEAECVALRRRVSNLENELCALSSKNILSQQYSTPLEQLEMCDCLSNEAYLLVFRDITGARVTVQLRASAVPELVQKLTPLRQSTETPKSIPFVSVG